MNIITMIEAKSLGLKRYFTGNPCPKGHVAERMVSTRGCCSCIKEKREIHRKERPEVNAESKRLYVRANPDKVKVWKQNERTRNNSSYVARQKKWYAENREQANAATAKWQRENRGLAANKSACRRVLKMNQTPTWCDYDAIKNIYRKSHQMRIQGNNVHVDHIIPLKGKNVCGLHVHYNLQIIDAYLNRSKSNSLKE